MAKKWGVVAVVSVAAAVSMHALADPTPARLVVLVASSHSDALTNAALARVQGELQAAGFEVQSVTSGADSDAQSALETIAIDAQPVAVLTIVMTEANVAKIAVSDRVHHTLLAQNVTFDPLDFDHSAQVLAVDSVDILKVNLASWFIDPAAPSASLPTLPAPSASVTPSTSAPVASPSPREFVVGVDGQIVLNFRGIPATVWPCLHAGLHPWEVFGFEASVCAFDSGIDLQSVAGSAHLHQARAVAGVQLHTPRVRTWGLYLSADLGAGAYWSNGSPATGYVGLTESAFAPIAQLAAGTRWSPVPHFALVLEVRGTMSLNPVHERIDATSFGALDAPSLTIGLGMEGAWGW
jgi:hypothetical protein